MYMYMERTICGKGCVIGSFLLNCCNVVRCRQAEVISFIPCYACDFVDESVRIVCGYSIQALCDIITDLV